MGSVSALFHKFKSGITTRKTIPSGKANPSHFQQIPVRLQCPLMAASCMISCIPRVPCQASVLEDLLEFSILEAFVWNEDEV